jgi:transcriptional regulator with XRE-family HTH domain
MERFGEKVRALRLHRGMSVRDLARALGYTAHSYIGDVEHNKRRPPADLVLKIAVFFGVSTDSLLRDDWELDLPAQPRDPANDMGGQP